MATSPSARNPKLPDWQRLFEAVFLEDDPKKLPQLVEAAQAAMYLRLQALVDSPDGHGERDAINDALRTMRAIETRKAALPKQK
jgi:hypothetical protein